MRGNMITVLRLEWVQCAALHWRTDVLKGIDAAAPTGTVRQSTWMIDSSSIVTRRK